MGRSCDRISNLPDPILQSILSLVPLKSAIRTSILSKRWRYLWEYSLISASTLDFSEDFACSQSPKNFVENVNRYLGLHGNQKLERFCVSFCPFYLFLHDIELWINFAVKKGIKELDLDLSQGYTDPFSGEFVDGRIPFELPNILYDCDSLTNLRLSRCNLTQPLNSGRFGNIQSLFLKHVNITQDMLERLLSDCLLLENLSLRNCQQLSAIYVTVPDIRLKTLVVVDCNAVLVMEISAPKLQSFHYYGRFCETSYYDISSLEDALICSIGRQDTYYDGDCMKIPELAHVKILTVCPETLVLVTTSEEHSPVAVPIQLQNLQELQILLDSLTDEHLSCIYNFFRLCPSPFLEKLFITLPRSEEDLISTRYWVNIVHQPPDIAFGHLKAIKVNNFKGNRTEMRLIKFLLKKAARLETLILVAPPICSDREAKECASRTQNERRMSLRILSGQLSLLPKASPRACIQLCEYLDDDKSLNPTHLEVYCDEIYFSGRSRHMFRPLNLEEAISALD